MASTSTNPRSVDRKPQPDWKFQPQNLLDSNEILSEEAFRRMISHERKRSERSQRPLALLLIDTGQQL